MANLNFTNSPKEIQNFEKKILGIEEVMYRLKSNMKFLNLVIENNTKIFLEEVEVQDLHFLKFEKIRSLCIDIIILIYEDKDSYYNFKDTIKKCSENLKKYKQKTSELDKLIVKIELIENEYLIKLKTYRDKVYGHYDKNFNGDILYNRDLIKIMNELEFIYDNFLKILDIEVLNDYVVDVFKYYTAYFFLKETNKIIAKNAQ